MTTVDSFKSSIVNFNNQWLLVETTTTKQKLPTPTKGSGPNCAANNLEISSSINCTSQDRMEILHNVILNGWLVQTISVFKPQYPNASAASSAPAQATSSLTQKNQQLQQETKQQNTIQPSLTESPKSTAFGSCGEEEIEEEEEDDEIIDEENQYDPEACDDDEQENGMNHNSNIIVEEQHTTQQKNANSNELLYQLISKLPIPFESAKPEQNENTNGFIKSPKKIGNNTSAFSRSTTNSSSSSTSISKSNKIINGQVIPAFSCDNIIEDQDKKKRAKKISILTDDSQNDGRQNFEAEDNSHFGTSARNSGEMQIEEHTASSSLVSTGNRESKRSSTSNDNKHNFYLQFGRSVSPYKLNGEEEEDNQLQISNPPNSSVNSTTSPLRKASSSVETALMMQLNNHHDSNLDILQNSSCSQNEDSSNFSIETDKLYNQLIRGKRNIIKKAIAKSSSNIDKPNGASSSSTNLQAISNNSTTKPRKSSYLNSIKLASSPSLTNLNYKRDRKNLVKNFIKAFRGFINNPSDEPEAVSVLKEAQIEPSQIMTELNEVRKKFEKFIQKKNYNNTLMVELIQNHEFSILFSHFLKEKAQEWIQTSKIKDKLSHEEALNHYLLSLKDTKALAKVRCLKYRSANNIEEGSISPLNNKSSGDQFATFQ